MSADQTLQCKDCPNTFLFTVRDQEFFSAQGFTPPKRCKPCRAIAKAKKEGGQAPSPNGGQFHSGGGYSSGNGGGGGGYGPPRSGGKGGGGRGRRNRDQGSYGED